MKEFYLIEKGDSWELKQPGNPLALHCFSSFSSAEEFLRRLSSTEEAAIRIQNREGRWRAFDPAEGKSPNT